MTSPEPAPIWDFFRQRRAGVLLHPSSLPSAGDGGDLGESAFRFVDFLARAGFTVWQMLPIGPTHEDRSPYQSLSVHAGDSKLISPDQLIRQGLLGEDLFRAAASREEWLYRAAQSVIQSGDALGGEHPVKAAFAGFCRENAHWLDDFALFLALRAHFTQRPWNEWPAELRHREPGALAKAREQHAAAVAGHQFAQFLFHRQWFELRDYALERDIHLFGDLPIFVSHDSADVWANQHLFKLDPEGNPTSVAGVPPDYFSATGQHWGNPHYHWDRMEADGFSWWLERLRHQLRYFDLLRVDHFRGFEAYWEIPADRPDPRGGYWVKAPGQAFLEACRQAFQHLPLVAENLGFITPEVEALRRRFGLPGMLVLQFAFDGSPGNPYLPHNHDPLEVVYTGTHDNDTTLGWFESLEPSVRENLANYFGRPRETMPDFLVRTAFASVARLAVVPMQDLLGLGDGNRMNLPGTSEGNWRWQFDWGQVPEGLADRLRGQLHLYRRLAGN